ncbi:MAG TPA: hypothetical protein VLH09_05485 [Bryobacteraceae bacterium]|nr:hypothetical protein [Bryobacteraceae bacterium]
MKRVAVPPLQKDERPRFGLLLETQRYLASARLAGPTLRYVAELDGQRGAGMEGPSAAGRRSWRACS